MPNDNSRSVNVNVDRGFLSMTFTSAVVTALSTYWAVTGPAAESLNTGDTVILGASVAAGTFVAAKLGKAIGKYAGGLAGLAFGGAAGAGLGGLASRNGEKIEGAAAGAPPAVWSAGSGWACRWRSPA